MEDCISFLSLLALVVKELAKVPPVAVGLGAGTGLGTVPLLLLEAPFFPFFEGLRPLPGEVGAKGVGIGAFTFGAGAAKMLKG